ncbi:Integrase catalytic core [Trinorchestia longiramus]|nr:Integrase catalytic core [Trinorchestia longiramus]
MDITSPKARRDALTIISFLKGIIIRIITKRDFSREHLPYPDRSRIHRVSLAGTTINSEVTRLLLSFLIDTGASLSIIPASAAERKQSGHNNLRAANGTPIECFGCKNLTCSLGLQRDLTWKFIVAAVDQPIIGADFLTHFGLVVDLKNKRIRDEHTNRTWGLTTITVSSSLHSIGVALNPACEYESILAEYPALTNPNFVIKESPIRTEHHILTTGPPVYPRARRLPPDRLEAAKKEFQQMLDAGTIRISKSPWASPLLLVPKSNGEFRPCGDYRRLNAVTTPDRFPIPHLQDFSANLHGHGVGLIIKNALNWKLEEICVGNELESEDILVGRLYRLDCSYHVAAKCSSVSSDDLLWHKRFCHLGFDNLKKLKSLDLVRGFDCSLGNENIFCENCCDGKSHRLPFSRVDQRKVRKPLELIHSDVCGKINPSSLGGGSYFVTFIDDYSRYTLVYIIKNKSDVFGVFTEFKALVENHYDHKIKILRTDNGGEYVSTDFERFLKVNGIVHQKTVPKTPEQNEVAERMNRTVLEAVRAMLADSKLPKTLWAEAVSTAVYVKNRSPTSAHKNLTPYQALNGHKPNVQHFRTFGCMAYAHVPKDEREKLDSKSKTCVLLGYGSGTKGYRLYDFNAKRVLLRRDVVFNESQFISFEKEPSKEIECVPWSFPQEEKHEDSEGELELRRSTRNRAAPDRFGKWVCFAQDKFDVPVNVEEALHGPESKLWKAAMEEEMASMNINNVWSLVECPKNEKPIRCKWIFKKKTGPDGNVCSYKARLVAQGYAQKFGVDYDETFSPVVRFESVRAVLALAAKHNLQLHHMDVATAFLNGELSEEIYLTQPEGFVSEGNENLVCRLNKSLYGLKQSPKCWNTALDGNLKQLGFKQSKNDACIYTRVSNKGLCIIAVYVDDIIIASDCLDEINEVKSCLSAKYKMKYLGKLWHYV